MDADITAGVSLDHMILRFTVEATTLLRMGKSLDLPLLYKLETVNKRTDDARIIKTINNINKTITIILACI